jgi:hypothetical protein
MDGDPNHTRALLPTTGGRRRGHGPGPAGRYSDASLRRMFNVSSARMVGTKM